MACHLWGDQSRHKETRAKAVEYLKTRPDLVATYAAEGAGHLGARRYLTQMAKLGTWGDELAILALAEAYQESLWVWSDQHDQESTYPGDARGPHLGLIHMHGNHFEILSL